MRTLLVGLVLATQSATPIFRFETGGFWLNLHHFLYVLGRVEATMPDITREAVAGAPADEESGLAGLGESNRRVWRDAVASYAEKKGSGIILVSAILAWPPLRPRPR